MNTCSKLPLTFSLVLATGSRPHAQGHGHLNIGALGLTPGDPLAFINGPDFAADTGYVRTLNFTNGGRFAGYFEGNFTLTVLPATAPHAGPDPAAPAPGTFVRFQMTCLSAPAGGKFGFWDSGSTAPSESLAAGQTGTSLWAMSESDGWPGRDPYGHIHGRRFTATKAGPYTVAFQAFDTSTNGPNGEPLHSPSASLIVALQAVRPVLRLKALVKAPTALPAYLRPSSVLPPSFLRSAMGGRTEEERRKDGGSTVILSGPFPSGAVEKGIA